MGRLPSEAPSEDVSQYFGGHARRYVQQRIPGALELDNVPLALCDLFIQGPNRVDVCLATHTGARFVSMPCNLWDAFTYIDNNSCS